MIVGLREAFAAYEKALMSNDLGALDALFADSARTLRSDGGTTLVGHATISVFRAGRGGAPQRALRRVHVRSITASAAMVVAEFVRADGTPSIQTQLWEQTDGRWQVSLAHVSAGAAPQSAVVDETAIWRVPPTTEPILTGKPGPLDHARVAVKDLFAIAGQRIGAGNPHRLAQAPIERRTAPAIAALVETGADVIGIAITDEFAFSLAGVNTHVGATPNPAAPGFLSGGSTSGPAAAVAAGLADLGLGTDTAGSIRVPASYCGLYGLRTTQGSANTESLVGLAESFDSIGLLARDPTLLAKAATAILPAQTTVAIHTVLVAPELLADLDAEAREAFEVALRAFTLRNAGLGAPGEPAREVTLPLGASPSQVADAFRRVQAAEAWRLHGAFITDHSDTIAPDVVARFRFGADIDHHEETTCRALLREVRARLRDLLKPGTVLALPSTSTAAPSLGTTPAELDTIRQATVRLTCLASAAGLPALSLPWGNLDGRPFGLCLVAGVDQDHSLLHAATVTS